MILCGTEADVTCGGGEGIVTVMLNSMLRFRHLYLAALLLN